jgi:hypothetical protein
MLPVFAAGYIAALAKNTRIQYLLLDHSTPLLISLRFFTLGAAVGTPSSGVW